MKNILTSTALLVTVLAGLMSASQMKAEESPWAPLPYTPRGQCGQALVDMELAKHPEIKIVVIHTTPLGVSASEDDKREILFSNIGRIGKPDIPEDTKVFRTGEDLVEPELVPDAGVMPWNITSPPKFGVLMVLHDRNGNAIGLASVIYPYKQGDDIAKMKDGAHAILKDIEQRIDSKEWLFAPAS